MLVDVDVTQTKRSTSFPEIEDIEEGHELGTACRRALYLA